MAVQFLSDEPDRIQDIAQFGIYIQGREIADGLGRPQWALESRSFTLHKMQPQPHGIGNGQDVREQNGRIKGKAPQRL